MRSVILGRSKSIPRTWLEQRPVGNVDKSWLGCSINDNGDAIAGINGGSLYMRINGVWSGQLGNNQWYCCSINNNGGVIAGVGYNGLLYMRINGVWSYQTPAGNVNKHWYCCSINDNGDAIAGNSSRLYTYEG
jgi:hypothetical protein